MAFRVTWTESLGTHPAQPQSGPQAGLPLLWAQDPRISSHPHAQCVPNLIHMCILDSPAPHSLGSQPLVLRAGVLVSWAATWWPKLRTTSQPIPAELIPGGPWGCLSVESWDGGLNMPCQGPKASVSSLRRCLLQPLSSQRGSFIHSSFIRQILIYTLLGLQGRGQDRLLGPPVWLLLTL